jgi:hypothetical protein
MVKLSGLPPPLSIFSGWEDMALGDPTEGQQNRDNDDGEEERGH